jgi:hypothetical protein
MNQSPSPSVSLGDQGGVGVHSALTVGPRRAGRLLVPAGAGAVAAVAVGVFGARHHPGKLSYDLGFSSLFAMKVWLAVGVGVLALLQLLSALWMFRRLPLGRPPRWIGAAHRATGTLAFLVSLPVAYACLYVLGFQHSSARVLAHSLLGCLFYGAFVTKVLTLHTSRLPRWALPVVGGVLFTVVIALVLTSAAYTLATEGSPGY